MKATSIGVPVHMTGDSWRRTYLALAERGLLSLPTLASVRRAELPKLGLADADWPIIAAGKLWLQRGLTVFEIRLIAALLQSQEERGAFPRALGGGPAEAGACYRSLAAMLGIPLDIPPDASERAMRYLLSIQLPDGGMPPFEGAPADVGTTARTALLLAKLCRRRSERTLDEAKALQRMTDFLRENVEVVENSRCAWRYTPALSSDLDEPPAVASTALAIQALCELAPDFDCAGAVQWLVDKADPGGGWEATASRPYNPGPTFWAVRALKSAASAYRAEIEALVHRTSDLVDRHAEVAWSRAERIYNLRIATLCRPHDNHWPAVLDLHRSDARHLLGAGALVYSEVANILEAIAEVRHASGAPARGLPADAVILKLPHEPFAGSHWGSGPREVLFEYFPWVGLWKFLDRIEHFVTIEQFAALAAATVFALGGAQSSPVLSVLSRHPSWAPTMLIALPATFLAWVLWKLTNRPLRNAIATTVASLLVGFTMVTTLSDATGARLVMHCVFTSLQIDLLSTFVEFLGIFVNLGRRTG